MATISHKNLSGSQLHENKGASAATDNQVATVTSGATVWQKLTASHLTGTGNSFGGQLNHYQNKLAANTAGQSITATTWTTRNLDTSVTTEITGPVLSANQITLVPAGTYYVEAWANAFCSGSNARSRIKVLNVTDAADLLVGRNCGTNTATDCLWAQVQGRFTLSGTKTISIQQFSSATGSNPAQNSGGSEIYCEVYLWRVA